MHVRDLNPKSIFFKEERNGYKTLKIGNYFHLKLPETSLAPYCGIGTPAYMAPELISFSTEELTEKSEIWSAGVILYELCAKKLPFTAKTVPGLMMKFKNEIYEEIPD